MRLSLPSLSSLPLFAATVTSSLTITIPPSALLPNPNTLPAGTHATLTTLPSSSSFDNNHALAGFPLTAPLTTSATFTFRNLPARREKESYLLDIRSAEYIFAPYRVDVSAAGKVLGIWETFRGNEWENRGAEKYNFVVDGVGGSDAGAGAGGSSMKVDEDVRVDARVVAKRGFYEQRAKFSPLSLVQNPMILMAIVALGLTFGMPKLMENMDPEFREEFEKHSRSSPISGGAQKAMAGGGAPGNFDFAGWMAGTAPGPMAGVEAAAQNAAQGAATGRERGNARRRG